MALASTTMISPASDDSQFMTQKKFDHFYDVHSSGIRYEFRRMSQEMEAGFQKVNDKLDRLEQSTDRRFEQVDRRFKQVDCRFEQVDRRFEQVDRRFEQVDRKLNSLDMALRDLAARSRNSAARSRNSTLSRLHQKIHAIDVLDSSEIPNIPADFPKDVKTFLQLRDNNSDSPQTLEEAVESNPDLALRDLAEALGLDLDRLEEGLRSYKVFASRQGQGPRHQHKRSQRSQTAAHDAKRQRPSFPTGQRRPSPPPPPPRDPELVALAFGEKSPSSSPAGTSVNTHLGWAANSEDFEAYQRALKEGTGKPETKLERLARRMVTRHSLEPKTVQAAPRQTDARPEKPQGTSQGSDAQDKQTPHSR
ncbi:MAG: hypothetical protein LQ338_003488 [Usnochroma carphineum]|nr:MAG: hypothetical protein LQ338_003488 [Usnochroma carphineum]